MSEKRNLLKTLTLKMFETLEAGPTQKSVSELTRVVGIWQGFSFQCCGINSKKEDLLDVGQGKVNHALPQLRVTYISCKQPSSFWQQDVKPNVPKQASSRWPLSTWVRDVYSFDLKTPCDPKESSWWTSRSAIATQLESSVSYILVPRSVTPDLFTPVSHLTCSGMKEKRHS